MHEQNERLKKTGRNLKKIQESAIPGLDKVLGLIRRAELKNTLILAGVIALCLAVLLYFNGFRALASALSTPNVEASEPSLAGESSNNNYSATSPP